MATPPSPDGTDSPTTTSPNEQVQDHHQQQPNLPNFHNYSFVFFELLLNVEWEREVVDNILSYHIAGPELTAQQVLRLQHARISNLNVRFSDDEEEENDAHRPRAQQPQQRQRLVNTLQNLTDLLLHLNANVGDFFLSLHFGPSSVAALLQAEDQAVLRPAERIASLLRAIALMPNLRDLHLNFALIEHEVMGDRCGAATTTPTFPVLARLESFTCSGIEQGEQLVALCQWIARNYGNNDQLKITVPAPWNERFSLTNDQMASIYRSGVPLAQFNDPPMPTEPMSLDQLDTFVRRAASSLLTSLDISNTTDLTLMDICRMLAQHALPRLFWLECSFIPGAITAAHQGEAPPRPLTALTHLYIELWFNDLAELEDQTLLDAWLASVPPPTTFPNLRRLTLDYHWLKPAVDDGHGDQRPPPEPEQNVPTLDVVQRTLRLYAEPYLNGDCQHLEEVSLYWNGPQLNAD